MSNTPVQTGPLASSDYGHPFRVYSSRDILFMGAHAPGCTHTPFCTQTAPPDTHVPHPAFCTFYRGCTSRAAPAVSGYTTALPGRHAIIHLPVSHRCWACVPFGLLQDIAVSRALAPAWRINPSSPGPGRFPAASVKSMFNPGSQGLPSGGSCAPHSPHETGAVWRFQPPWVPRAGRPEPGSRDPRGRPPVAEPPGPRRPPLPARPLTIGATSRLVLAIATAVKVLALEILHDAGRKSGPGSHGPDPPNATQPRRSPPPPHNAPRRPEPRRRSRRCAGARRSGFAALLPR